MIILRQIEYSSKKKEDVDKNRAKAAGVGGLGVGLGLLATTKKSHLTGREKFWHSTDKANINSIMENGIQGRFASDPDNLTNKVLTKIPSKKKEGLVYISKKKSLADNVGVARDARAPGKARRSKTLEVVMDYDELKKKKTVINPEVFGMKKKEFLSHRLKENDKYLKEHGIEKRSLDETLEKLWNDNKIYNDLGPKTTKVVKGDIPAKAIKGSKHFEGNSAKKVAKYIKNNPKRFTKQALKGAAGVAAIGYGVKKLYDANKKKEKDV